MNTTRLALALCLAGCAPVGLGNPWMIVPPDAATIAQSDAALARTDAVDAPRVDRAEVLSVDVLGADVVVLDGDAAVVWITDRPVVVGTDTPDAGTDVGVDAPVVDAGNPTPDAPTADAGAPTVDAPVVDVPLPCGALQDRCGGVCAALLVDPANCGACGRVCPSTDAGVGVCNGGRCEVACREGYADCERGCQDVQGDHGNCGMCGRGCSGTQTCRAGQCVGCPAGETACDGACVRLDTAEHCGACSRHCPLGAACARGTTCEYTSCAAGHDAGTWTLCPDGCVDVRSDDRNCLGCGNACATGTHCVSGCN